VLLFAVSLAILHSRLAPPWVAWLGFVSAALGLVGTGLIFTEALFPLVLLGLILSGAWLVAVCHSLQRKLKRSIEPVPQPAT